MPTGFWLTEELHETDTPVGENFMAADELLLHLQHLRNRRGGLSNIGFGIGELWLWRVQTLQGSARASSALHCTDDFQPWCFHASPLLPPHDPLCPASLLHPRILS